MADEGECLDTAFVADNRAYSNILMFVIPCAEHPVYLRYCTMSTMFFFYVHGTVRLSIQSVTGGTDQTSGGCSVC